MEYNTAHTTTRCRQTWFLDTDNTGVAWIVSREETCKRQPVASDAGVISAILVCNLGCSGFSCHLKWFGTSLSSQALTDNMFQNGLHGFNCLWFGNAFLQDNRFKFLDNLAILHDLLHKTWLHHFSIVGYSIVERYSINGRNLCLVSNTHPRQSGLTPIFRAVGSLGVWHSDHRGMITDDRNFQIFVDTNAI